jgi:hypothetical protein
LSTDTRTATSPCMTYLFLLVIRSCRHFHPPWLSRGNRPTVACPTIALHGAPMLSTVCSMVSIYRITTLCNSSLATCILLSIMRSTVDWKGKSTLPTCTIPSDPHSASVDHLFGKILARLTHDNCGHLALQPPCLGACAGNPTCPCCRCHGRGT